MSAQVRVFEKADEFEQDRFAVFNGEAWVEVASESVTVVEGPEGLLASIVVPCTFFGDVEVSSDRQDVTARVEIVPLSKPDAFGSPIQPQGQRREQVERETKAVLDREALPVWGDESKPRVRFFKITTEDGRVFPNNASDLKGSDARAADHLRSRWDMLVQGQQGKKAAKVELQPEGRIGSDRPDLAPPRGALDAHADDERPDNTG